MVFSNSLTINPPKTKFCFAPDVASFPLKRYDVIVFISARKLCFLPFFLYHNCFYNILICGDITDYVYLCAKFLIIMDNTKCLNHLRVVLADKQITNKWVAGEMGVNEMTVSRWRTNKVQPSVAQLVEIAKLLKVDIKDLIEADFDYEIEE